MLKTPADLPGMAGTEYFTWQGFGSWVLTPPRCIIGFPPPFPLPLSYNQLLHPPGFHPNLVQSIHLPFAQVFPQEENLEMLGYNFAFLSQIARGRDTVVYDAVEKTNGRRVAVKIFDTYKDYKHPPKEARLLQEVTGHPYIQVGCGV